MHHPGLDVGRFGIAGRATGFGDTTLIDGDIHKHAAGHALQIGGGQQCRRMRAGNQCRADE